MVDLKVSSPSGAPPGDHSASLVDILRWRAAHQADRLAYVFLSDGRSQEKRITYVELDRAAGKIAARLLEVAAPEDRALLLYPSGPEFLEAFLGCLYAGIIGIPLYPPRPNRSISRLEVVFADSGAQLALTPRQKLPELDAHLSSIRALAGIKTLATDEADSLSSSRRRTDFPRPGGLAYMQYTSGSTSVPKGVMVTHSNLVYNCSYMMKAWSLSEQDTAVTWLPHFHDMGLIDGLLNPLFGGYPSVVLSPPSFVQRPLLWLQAVTRYRATHSGAPNFAFDLCVSKIKPQQLDELDLSSWTNAYSGAEPVRAETLERFSKYFAPCGFRRRALNPSYGLAEATLMVSGGVREAGPQIVNVDGPALEAGRVVEAAGSGKSRTVVGCGRILGATGVAIVNPNNMQRCPAGTVGEIWVSGPTVPAGYWQRAESTKETFRAHTSDGEGPFMRTGDLGFFVHEHLFIAGRTKDLIIIRGDNYYPQDIEWLTEATHPALRKGRVAAFSIDLHEAERLVIVQEVERQHRKSTPEEFEVIARTIRLAVAEEFEVQTYCIQLLDVGGVHMTSSGKVQRSACKSDFLAGKLNVLYESLPIATSGGGAGESSRTSLSRSQLAQMRPNNRQRAVITYLRRLVADVLGASPADVTPEVPLGSLGIDSLKGNELTAILQQDFQIPFSNTMVWNYPTILDISGHIVAQLALVAGDAPQANAPQADRHPSKAMGDGPKSATEAEHLKHTELLGNSSKGNS